MNGGLAVNAQLLGTLAAKVENVAAQVVVCVPFPYLQQAQAALNGSRMGWGAQDVSAHPKGAFTAEVSVSMLRDFGCSHVIVGHSERRQHHGEASELVATKAEIALAGGLTPIVCIGETLAERDGNQVEAVLERQIRGSLAGLNAEQLTETVIAYEPVWAIGTGRTATPQQAQDAHAFIRRKLTELWDAATADKVRIQYGGSVKPANTAELMSQPDIDGALVGGASLDPRGFAEIVLATVKLAR